MRSRIPFLATLLAPLSATMAGTLYVPSPEYPTIQSAIDAAAPGDAVVLHDGVFWGEGNTDLLLGDKPLTLRSENGPAACTIDCGRKTRGLRIVGGASAETTIDGITIRDATPASGNGGGICCDQDGRVNVLACTINGCEASDVDCGGGISCAQGSQVSIRYCEISKCRAGAYAGGVFCDGGSNVEIIACTLRDNEVYEADGFGGHGGGLAMRSATVTVSDTDIVNNWAIGDGGAVTCDEYSNARMIRCRLLRNTASGRGGGICFWDDGSPEFSDCIVAGNLCWSTNGGGGVFCHESTPAVDHCTIVTNRASNAAQGGGVYSEGAGCPVVTSCIVWDNVGGSIFLNISWTGAVSYSDVEGGFDGFGNIDADPRFAGPGRGTMYVDAANAGDPLADGSQKHPYGGLKQVIGIEADLALDYRLAYDSPCIGQAADEDNMGALRGTDGPAAPEELIVHVAAGVYSLVDCSFQRHVSLIGAGAEKTILEGPPYMQRYAAGVQGLRTGALLKGVTVRNSGWDGVHIDTQQAPAVEDCVITQSQGGGVNCTSCSPVFSRCVISENTGWSFGGVLCMTSGSPSFTNCTIRGNTAYAGAGIYASNGSTPVIRSCTIVENTATDEGGGVYCAWGSGATLVDSEIRDNNGGQTGGGVLAWNSDITLSNCLITGNSAWSGGGVALTGASYGVVGHANMVNCVVEGNRATGGQGGGLFCQGYAGLSLNNSLVAVNSASDSGGGLACDQSNPVNLTNCTVAGNFGSVRGGALFSNCSQVSMANSVLWGNTAGRGPTITLMRSCAHPPTGVVLAVVYSLVQGGQAGVDADAGCLQSWGASNRDADPLFLNPAGQDGNPATWADNDYRPGSGSPVIDAGNNDLAPIDSTDLDGDGQKTECIPFDLAGLPRRLDDPASPDVPGGGPPTVDMGAYEYFTRVRADFDGDGDVDADDLGALRACWAGPAVSPLPEGCAAKDLDGDGDVDLNDFGLLQRCFSGHAVLADPSCVN